MFPEDLTLSIVYYEVMIKLDFIINRTSFVIILHSLFFFHAHREESTTLTDELSEESDQFRFLRVVCFANLKGTVGLIMKKASDIRISSPPDLSDLFHSYLFLVSSFVSSHTDFNPFPRNFSFTEYLSDTC